MLFQFMGSLVSLSFIGSMILFLFFHWESFITKSFMMFWKREPPHCRPPPLPLLTRLHFCLGFDSPVEVASPFTRLHFCSGFDSLAEEESAALRFGSGSASSLRQWWSVPSPPRRPRRCSQQPLLPPLPLLDSTTFSSLNGQLSYHRLFSTAPSWRAHQFPLHAVPCDLFEPT